jgi:hypothetical protein
VIAGMNISDSDDCRSIPSTEAVEVAKNENTQADLFSVSSADEGSKPPCGISQCASMTEMITQTMENLCVSDPVDSRGLREESTEARTTKLTHLSHEDISDESIVSFLGMEVQVWQKRGRFLVWPVSLGEEGKV